MREAPDNATADKTDKLIGEILASRYQIEGRIGEGAMGTVYRAKHVKVGRPFAVKVLHKKLLEDRKVAQRFEREAELAGRLRHPNVVGVVDVGETTDGLRYMVMDFAQGDDLATLLNDAPMPTERIIKLTKQMLEGLYHAHEAGLIHRDFKPENVIVERDDHGTEVPRIVDFGIAILREGGSSSSSTGRLTTNGLVLGTPHYMAPEQAVADPIDHRIDLFALGIVVYEMLSGKLPFDGTGAEVARANLLLDPPMIAVRVPYLEVDPLLEAFARQLMAKKRELRPATAKVARDILELIERDRPAAALALGVPSLAARTPQVTQPVTPHRAAVNEESGSYTTPSDAAIANWQPPTSPAAPKVLVTQPGSEPSYKPKHVPRASQLEAPPVSVTPAQIKPLDAPERKVSASRSTPLAWAEAPKRSRRGWVLGGIGMLAVGGIALAFVGSQDQASGPTPANPEQVAVAGSDVAGDAIASVSLPVTPPVVVEPPVAAVADAALVDPTPTSDPAPAGTTPEPTDTGSAGSAAQVATDPPDPRKDKRRGSRGSSRDRARTSGRVEPVKTPDPVKPVEIKPAEPVKVPTPTDTTPRGDNLLTRYQVVGRTLKDMGEKATDLWPRYRLININKVMMAPERRADAIAILSELEKLIAQRK